jgi:hypothetical protein
MQGVGTMGTLDAFRDLRTSGKACYTVDLDAVTSPTGAHCRLLCFNLALLGENGIASLCTAVQDIQTRGRPRE